MSTGIITLGIGPNSSLVQFLLLGLQVPPSAHPWRTYDATDDGGQYAAMDDSDYYVKDDGLYSPTAARSYSADRQG